VKTKDDLSAILVSPNRIRVLLAAVSTKIPSCGGV